MSWLSAILTLFLLSLSHSPVRASPCLAFDVDFKLYAFGLGSKDWTVGTQDVWTSGAWFCQFSTIGQTLNFAPHLFIQPPMQSTSRLLDVRKYFLFFLKSLRAKPRNSPFDGVNTSCYLAQFFNAIYVLNGDAKNPNSIYIYDAGAKAWSNQTTTPGSFDYSSAEAILDHDTNVFCELSHSASSAPPHPLPDAFSKGKLYNLNMAELKAARSSALKWEFVGDLGFPDNYNPTMALAQNHIHFLNVGNDGAGNARIFVIHCKPSSPRWGIGFSLTHLVSYLQPDLQDYPGEKTFPAAHGQTASFFKQTGPQQEFAYIPDDFSGTYVINVENNSTRTLPPPMVKDTKSSYVAGITSLVQLDSTGGVSFVPYVPGKSSDNANATWSTIKALAGLASPSTSTSGNPQATGAGGTKTSQSDGALSSHTVTSGLFGISVLFAILGFF